MGAACTAFSLDQVLCVCFVFVELQPSRRLTMTEPEAVDSFEKNAQSHGLTVRDAVVFLVDWRRSMLTKSCPVSDGSEATAPVLHVVLKCISSIMKEKILARSSDLISVIAFGIHGEGERESWPRMRVIQPLEGLTAAGILRLDSLAESAKMLGQDELVLESSLNDDAATGNKNVFFGDNTPVEFDKALWAAKHEFAEKTKADKPGLVHRRKIFVLTDDDDPSGGSVGSRSLSVTQAKDLFEQNATIDVTLLSSEPASEEEDLNTGRSSFFYKVIAAGDEEQDLARKSRVTENVASLDDLALNLRKRQRTKRALCRTTFELGPGYKFGVALYSLAQKSRRPTRVDLAADTNQQVKKITTATCEAVGTSLKKSEIRLTYRLPCLKNVRPKKITNDPKTAERAKATEIANAGGPPLFGFTHKELGEIGDFGVTGLVLVGFKPLSSFRKENIMRAPSFVYPDDKSYTGSTAVFTQLLNSMVKKEVLAIALVSLRRGSAPPRFAALLPQPEEYENGVQVLPPGFQCFALPYKNDIRTAWRADMAENEPVPPEKNEDVLQKDEDVLEGEPQPEPSVDLPVEGLDEARKMIGKLTINHYDPRDFKNPDMQRFYAGLEAAAGVDGGRKQLVYKLDPNLDQMEDRAGKLMEEFKNVTMGDEFDGAMMAERYGTKTAKRAFKSAGRASAKRQKTETETKNAMDMVDTELFKERFRTNSINKFIKVDLLAYLRVNGVECQQSCKKAKCVELVYEHLGKSMS